jgi:hypothetical protein
VAARVVEVDVEVDLARECAAVGAVVDVIRLQPDLGDEQPAQHATPEEPALGVARAAEPAGGDLLLVPGHRLLGRGDPGEAHHPPGGQRRRDRVGGGLEGERVGLVGPPSTSSTTTPIRPLDAAATAASCSVSHPFPISVSAVMSSVTEKSPDTTEPTPNGGVSGACARRRASRPAARLPAPRWTASSSAAGAGGAGAGTSVASSSGGARGLRWRVRTILMRA